MHSWNYAWTMSARAIGVPSTPRPSCHPLWSTCGSSWRRGWTHCQRNRQLWARRSTSPTLNLSRTHLPRDSIPADLQSSTPGRSPWKNVHCAETHHITSIIVLLSMHLRMTNAQLWHISTSCATTVSIQDTTDTHVQARGRVRSAI